MTEREQAQALLVEALSEHTAYLHRADTAHVNKAKAVIDNMAAELAGMLSDRLDGLAPAELQAFAAGRYHTDRLKGLRKAIDTWAATLGERVRTLSRDELDAIARQEAGYMRDLLAQVVDEELPPAPVAAAAAATFHQPVLGQFVEDMLAQVPEDTKRTVYSRIRQGVTSGETNGDIVRALRGTQALQYRDGVLQQTRNQVERLVRTARAHASHVAYEETYDALDVREVVWVATLEGRTCKRCAPLDGRRFKRDAARPIDPLHPNCRCKVVPSLDDDVMGKRPYVRALKVTGRNGNTKFRSIGNMTKRQRERAGLDVGQTQPGTTFSSWFANRDAAFQLEWLGDTRYKLYKQGGYSLDRFTDPRHKEYSIEDLRRKDAETFERLFG